MSPTPTAPRTLVFRAWQSAIVDLIIVAALLAIPMYVIRPFVPQTPAGLAFALEIRGGAFFFSLVLVLMSGFELFKAWRFLRLGSRIVLSILFLLLCGEAALTRVNVFEKMFKPYGAPAFDAIDAAQVDADDKVLAVSIQGESHAYPVRTMGYHHIVNDVVGGQPVGVTYCTLCHTGMVWSRVLSGQTLTFRLAGINNGNALLRDEQSDSIWQQSTGECIYGSHKGQHLTLVHSDELTFAVWKAERPGGVVLKPEAQYANEYDPKDWEKHVERTRTVVDTSKSGISPHELMLGVTVGSQTKAYPVKTVLAAGLVNDDMGRVPLVVVVGPDHASFRVFQSSVGQPTSALTFGSSEGANGQIMKDTETGSAWNFQGCAVSGKYLGQCLLPMDAHQDYWFDWLNHNPATAVFKD